MKTVLDNNFFEGKRLTINTTLNLNNKKVSSVFYLEEILEIGEGIEPVVLFSIGLFSAIGDLKEIRGKRKLQAAYEKYHTDIVNGYKKEDTLMNEILTIVKKRFNAS